MRFTFIELHTEETKEKMLLNTDKIEYVRTCEKSKGAKIYLESGRCVVVEETYESVKNMTSERTIPNNGFRDTLKLETPWEKQHDH